MLVRGVQRKPCLAQEWSALREEVGSVYLPLLELAQKLLSVWRQSQRSQPSSVSGTSAPRPPCCLLCLCSAMRSKLRSMQD